MICASNDKELASKEEVEEEQECLEGEVISCVALLQACNDLC